METDAPVLARNSRSGEQFVLRMPDGMRAQLKEISAANRRSMNAQMVVLLEEGIKQQTRSIQQ